MASFDKSTFKEKYKKGDDKVKTRLVGLELEVIIDKDKLPITGASYIDKVGQLLKKDKMDKIFPGVGCDGDDIEVVTHPESINFYLDGGSDALKDGANWLENNTRAGFDAAASGTHVNISFLPNEETEVTMDKVYWICMNFAPQLTKLAGRITHWAYFCPYRGSKKRTSPASYNRAVPTFATTSIKPDTMQKRQHCGTKTDFVVYKTNRIEFRLFKSTHTLHEMLAWAELCHNIVELASNGKKLDSIKFTDLINGPHINPYALQMKGERKLTDEEICAQIANIIAFKTYSSPMTYLLKEE